MDTTDKRGIKAYTKQHTYSSMLSELYPDRIDTVIARLGGAVSQGAPEWIKNFSLAIKEVRSNLTEEEKDEVKRKRDKLKEAALPPSLQAK